jgi:signal peptidase II
VRFKLLILLVASDQILKLLAVKFFHPALNSGVAFGVGENIPVIATIVVYLILSISIYKSRFKYGEMLLLAGGAGNILDRLIYGKIVDWIKFGNLWFNLADVYISLGVLMIVIDVISSKIKSQNSKPNSKFKN